jgi:hypothetical protein
MAMLPGHFKFYRTAFGIGKNGAEGVAEGVKVPNFNKTAKLVF